MSSSRGFRVRATRPGLAVCLLLAAVTGAGCDPEPSRELQEEVRGRWNALPGLQAPPLDFRWPELDRFPHPTFQGGTPEAYRRFAELLVSFLESQENFDYLAKHGLFRLKLRNVFPSGQVGVETTFEELTSLDAGLPTDTADRLRRLHDRILAQR
jgi:hypothetical protein